MAQRRYTVTGPHTTLGHAPGESFDYTLTISEEAYYIEAGHLTLAKDAPKPEPIRCPACVAHGTQKEAKATYATLEALQEHYATDHVGLAPPTEEA